MRSFAHINATARAALAAGEPTISVDAKKRELVGDFKAVGREYEPTGRPVEVRCHDFKDKDLGHAIPYGVYDMKANEGMVSVGVTNDTSAFASLHRGEILRLVDHHVSERPVVGLDQPTRLVEQSHVRRAHVNASGWRRR